MDVKSPSVKRKAIEFTCFCCGESKRRGDFYATDNPIYKLGITPICKDCARDLSFNDAGIVTESSIKLALESLDKPFMQSVFDATMKSLGKDKRNINNILGLYIRRLPKGVRWRDSDDIKYNGSKFEIKEREVSADVTEMYHINKREVIRMLGYDPFTNEPDDEKPLLYAKMSDMCDESTLEDSYKLNVVIEIIKTSAQIERLNNAIAAATQNVSYIMDHIVEFKALTEAKQKLVKNMNDLAKDNGISLINSTNKSKGAGTLSGIIKKLKEMDLRAAEENLFDTGTCDGMKQVAEISNSSILKQIALDENDYTEMLEEQRKLIITYQQQLDEAQEELRLLKIENRDLKSFLIEKGLVDENFEVIT